MTVFLYLVDGVLVDTGQRRMQKYVAEIVKEKNPSCVLLTHHHEDHSGNAGMLGDAFGMPIYGHPLARAKMEDSFHILPYQHYMSGKAGRAQITPFPPVIQTDHLCFRPVHTPGHSKDHTVYLEEQNGWLFSGDLYLGDKVHFFRVDERIGDQIASLEKILQLDFDALFCGHRPHPDNGRARLMRKLEFLRSFHGNVGLLAQKGYPEKAIIQKMRFKSDRKVKCLTLGNASFANMVRASLREMLAAGRAK